MTNDNIKLGDQVEVTFRGRVTGDIDGRLRIKPEQDFLRTISEIKGSTITVIPKPVEVGDEVDGDTALALPIGSVVLYEPGQGASLKVGEDEWVSLESLRYAKGVEDKIFHKPAWLTVKLKVLHVGKGAINR